MPMEGRHEQSSLNYTKRDLVIVAWATAGSMGKRTKHAQAASVFS